MLVFVHLELIETSFIATLAQNTLEWLEEKQLKRETVS